VLCDRGTLDGLAYWPGLPDEYFADLETTRERELARYASVIQLRPPSLEQGYRTNSVRYESPEQAAAIDARITDAWAGHRRHFIVESDANFLVKLRQTIELISSDVPDCCKPSADRIG
jgi:hypothetical protein